jgi:hypothetical protein
MTLTLSKSENLFIEVVWVLSLEKIFKKVTSRAEWTAKIIILITDQIQLDMWTFVRKTNA